MGRTKRYPERTLGYGHEWSFRPPGGIVSVEAVMNSTLASRHLLKARASAELASEASEPVVGGAVLTGGLEMLMIPEAFRAYVGPFPVVVSKQASRSLPAQGSDNQSVCTP